LNGERAIWKWKKKSNNDFTSILKTIDVPTLVFAGNSSIFPAVKNREHGKPRKFKTAKKSPLVKVVTCSFTLKQKNSTKQCFIINKKNYSPSIRLQSAESSDLWSLINVYGKVISLLYLISNHDPEF
jgi:hypothetical protein